MIEGFGELDIPIIKNGIVESLDGNMAGRMTSYSTSGLVETWKLGLTSQINDDVRLRFTMSYDIRAPNLGELYNTVPASGGQVDYKNGINSPSALSESAGNVNLVPETAADLFGRHCAHAALGARPDHVVRLVFDQREGHHHPAPQWPGTRSTGVAGTHATHRRELLRRLDL